MRLKWTLAMSALAGAMLIAAATIPSGPAAAANEAKCRELAKKHAPGQNPDARKTRQRLYRLCMEKGGKL